VTPPTAPEGAKPLVIVPDPVALELIGDVRDDVTLKVWEATDDPPAEVADVEFFVSPGGFGDVGDRVRAALPEMRNLRVLQALTAGVDHFEPFAPARATVCNMRGVHLYPVSEWVVGMVISALREFPRYADAQRRGDSERHYTDTLYGKRVLVIGYGEIGKATARILSQFHVELRCLASSAREGVLGPESLDEVLPSSDVVVLVCPLTPETTGILSAERLKRLPPGALVVNASRGGLIDQAALVDQARAGRLVAILDAVDPEPLPADDPLRFAPNVVYTPHVAAATTRGAPLAYEVVGRQLSRFLAGEPLENVVREGQPA
jgi:phosphoglycerate dehydrogenase-like enzyme